MEANEIKKYENEDIVIVWKQSLCIHSKNCWKGLPKVFKPMERPWINENGESSDKIMEQINKCPSGALSYINKKK